MKCEVLGAKYATDLWLYAFENKIQVSEFAILIFVWYSLFSCDGQHKMLP